MMFFEISKRYMKIAPKWKVPQNLKEYNWSMKLFFNLVCKKVSWRGETIFGSQELSGTFQEPTILILSFKKNYQNHLFSTISAQNQRFASRINFKNIILGNLFFVDSVTPMMAWRLSSKWWYKVSLFMIYEWNHEIRGVHQIVGAESRTILIVSPRTQIDAKSVQFLRISESSPKGSSGTLKNLFPVSGGPII